ncbi:MAG TPA: DUF2339 domain-containing protein [Pyrinomonadaceae bacterium]|nr:DUF2339 domain-containing protein [Pyrinomonadaceae bacterium]
MEAAVILVILFILALLVSALVLPIVALVIAVRAKRTSETIARLQNLGSLGVNATQPAQTNDVVLRDLVQELSARVARLETGQSAGVTDQLLPTVSQPPPLQPPPLIAPPAQPTSPEVSVSGPSPVPPPPPAAPMFSAVRAEPSLSSEGLESIVGRRAVGWAAVALIILATAFFLKYAFDNRWIGELGRVAIGVLAGVSVTVLGFHYHKRGWRVFSQILTACGIVLLYLSVYAAFGYYHLTTQKTAFVFLTVLIIEAGLLAILYNAPAIAVMAVLGGFLSPILLHSDRDQYRSLFGYLALIDVGTLALFKRWPGLSSLAFSGTHFLFWLWFAEHYHPQKRAAVVIFQTALFAIFLISYVGRRLLKRDEENAEDLALLSINPFVFFSTAYFLLNADHHDWMGLFAVAMALLYAVVAKILLDRKRTPRIELLVMIGIALTFATLAIPIQLKSNWITIAWSVEALALLWTSIESKTERLRAIAWCLFGLSLTKLILWDTPWWNRRSFTPILNKYFLSALVIIACLGVAAALCRKLREQDEAQGRAFFLGFVLVAIAVLWFVLSFETFTFFNARALVQETIEDHNHELWLGQLALSVLWTFYAATLAVAGFVRRSAVIRWAALGLFGLTTVKVMLVDVAVLERFYRIIAFFVLGVVLLLVARGYHKAFHSRESEK